MSYHARPLQVTAGTPGSPRIAPPDPTEAALPPALDSDAAAPAAAEPRPLATPSDNHAARSRDSAARRQQVPAATWYRRERWLVVTLVAFLPVLAALFAPMELRLPLVGASVLLVLIGVGMLLRHGALQTDDAACDGTGRAGTLPRAQD